MLLDKISKFSPYRCFNCCIKRWVVPRHVARACSLLFSGRPTFAFFLLVVEFALIAAIFQGILVFYFAAVKFVFVTGDLG